MRLFVILMRTRPRVPIVLAALASLVAMPVRAQGVGRIVGRIVDAASGAGLSGVTVQVVGTTIGTQSGVDGRFSVGGVRAGTITLHARRLGFQPKTVTGLMLAEGGTVEQNIALAEATVRLTATVVTAERERGSVRAALDAQQHAAGVVNAITAEQIQRSPDADAAQAVQRVSGVTVQEGRYVQVRGLGERYTTTSLNGARLPSPEPERKVVPLDLFPSGLIQSVTTSKTFTPDQPGDFSGAAVDIRTREYPSARQFSYATTIGFTSHDGAAFRAPGVGGEQFALAGRARHLPRLAAELGSLGSATRPQKNALIDAFRDVWRPEATSARPNVSASASVGGSDPIFGHEMGYLLSGSYSNSRELRSRESRALARPGDVGAPAIEHDRFEGTTSRTSVLLGGLLNLSTLLGSSSRLSLNNSYNRTADDDARTERGSLEDLGIPVAIQRLDYVERSVWSSQLAGEHAVGRHALDWAVTASGVHRDQPDRSELVSEITHDAQGEERLLWLNSSSEGAVRTFATLGERAYEGRVDHRLEVGVPRQFVKGGLLGRRVDRDADSRSYGIYAPMLTEPQRALAPEALFGGALTQPDSAVLDIRTLSQGGSYTASDRLAAGYLMADVGPSERLRFVGGARVERSTVRVHSSSTLNEQSLSDRTFTDVLPSLAMTWKPTASQNVRLSATRTLARPEYRELADVTSRDVLGGVNLRGNPGLVRTSIDNLDARWELYPSRDEIVSVALFAKRFTDPIERVFRPTSTASIVSFVNAKGARNVGLELELRKRLGFVAPALRDLAFFTNATLMRSEIDLSRDAGAATNDTRAMVGQAPYVVNAGMSWADRRGASATLLFNRVGERIFAAGELPLPDVTERPRNVLDVSLRVPTGRGLSIRADAKNLLDAPYELRQGGVLREYHRSGRTAQIGVALQR